MQKSSPTLRWWDWSSIFLQFLLLETVASRLVATDWTPFLFLARNITYYGFVIGTILGYTRFSHRASRWLSFLYMIVLLPLQWMLVIDQSASLEEQQLSVGGRLSFSFLEFFARRPVEDPLFFIALVTFAFWIISASAGFRLVRYQNYLMAVIPSAIGLLIIQSYDNSVPGRIWIMAFYVFLALLLLGRLNNLENKKSWRERRIFLSPDNSIDLTNTMAVAAGLIIIFSWTAPASIESYDSAVESWNKITRPWRVFTDRMENAFSSLDSPSGGKRGEFFGSEIALGRGFPLSDVVMFTVQTPELQITQKPPRYYWRGRTYDYFLEGQWYTTQSNLEEYSPSDVVPMTFTSNPERFVFNTGKVTLSLVYTPSQAVWLSRQGSTRRLAIGNNMDEIISWYANPFLLPGEIYQVEAILNNPDIESLRQAGTDYPSWVTNQYLQVPDDFSTKVSDLAKEITSDYDNSFDKTTAITRYLRDNIEYSDSLPLVPRNADPIEWMLFEHKEAYCVYYSTAEILMLRSLGIPARLAVGFAQGERDGSNYIVRGDDAHAWPEVYFPNIGWVEFEPTGSQPTLSRPLPRSVDENNGIDSNLPDLANLENNPNELQGPEEDAGQTFPDQTGIVDTVNPSLYLIPLLIIFAALTVYFGRRYSIPVRLPSFLRNTYERTGTHTPNWVVNWERWANTSRIQRSFESINFALSLLRHPVPVHATPIERANELQEILPKAVKHTQNLLDEHQTSLYTSRKADEQRARLAAFNIRKYALLEAIRYIFEGRPIQDL